VKLKTSVGSKSRRSGLMRKEAVAAYLFLTPCILGLLIFEAGPVIASAVLSLMDWDLLSPPKWVGLSNFREMLLRDKLVPLSMFNTVYYTFFGVPLQLVAALGAALLLNSRVRGIRLYRTAFYVPSVTPAVANAILWVLIFNPESGIANYVLSSLGLPTYRWLVDPPLAKPAFILMSLWGIGPTMVIFLAGLQGIPEYLYEAASIDGAGALRNFRHITIPMLTPTIFFNLIIGVIGSFQVFTNAYIMTGGGPANATLFYMLYVYRNAFQYLRMGYASTLAWFLFLVIALLTAVQFGAGRRWVYYEGELRS